MQVLSAADMHTMTLLKQMYGIVRFKQLHPASTETCSYARMTGD